jgi:hypothetical protein
MNLHHICNYLISLKNSQFNIYISWCVNVNKPLDHFQHFFFLIIFHYKSLFIIGFTPQKIYLKGRGSRSTLSFTSLPFLLLAHTLSIPFWFFLLFVGVLRPDKQFWPLCYASTSVWCHSSLPWSLLLFVG